MTPEVAQYARNVRRFYRKARVAERRKGRMWYADAHRFCAILAREKGLSIDVTCGVLAALSPRVSWSENLRAALCLVKLDTLPAGTMVLPANVAKALRILKGEAPLDVLRGEKVVAFYLCIRKPATSRAVCVDTHAIRAAIGDIEADEHKTSPYFRKARSRTVQDAYRRVARQERMQPHRLQAVVWLVVKRLIEELPTEVQTNLYVK